MKTAILYIHGAGGNAEEAEHYRNLFPACEVLGFDYRAQTPWEAVPEFRDYFRTAEKTYDTVLLIANSIGAYYALCSLNGQRIRKAYLISPVVDMDRLISDRMEQTGVTEKELTEKGRVTASTGEEFSLEYRTWVREHPVFWTVPTAILYGSLDGLQSYRTVKAFAEKTGASLTVMENGEHWFHTGEQMAFLDQWLLRDFAQGEKRL